MTPNRTPPVRRRKERVKTGCGFAPAAPPCHAQADFAATLCYGVAQHTVGADGGEQQRYARKRPASQCHGERRATRRYRQYAFPADRRSLTGNVGVDLASHLLQRQPERFRWKARADGDEDAVVEMEGVGIINRALGFVFGEPRLFRPANNADHSERVGIFPRFGPFPQALANRTGVWPVVSRQVFIHNAGSLGAV